MALILPAPPQDVYDALDVGLHPLASSPGIAAHLPHAAKAVAHVAPGAGATTPAPQRPNVSLSSFVLELNTLADGELNAARPTGWHHLLATGVGSATVLARTALRNNKPTFAALSESPFADELQDRIALLQGDPQINAGSFEAVLLQIPALHVVAIWLKDAAHHHDLIVPLAPAFAPLKAGQKYTAAQFVAELRPLARAKLQADHPRQGG